MEDVKVSVSDRVILALLAVFGFALFFNVCYSVQRELSGFQAIPMWQLFILICLVAKPGRNQKIAVFVGALSVAIGLEYYRMTTLQKSAFDPVSFVLLVVTLYGMALVYFMLILFARLDKLEADYNTLSLEIKGLVDEASRVAKTIEKVSQTTEAPREIEVSGPAANYILYRRAFADLAGMRTAKDLPGFLARGLKDGFGVDRGLILEVLGAGQTVVRDGWGDGLPKGGTALSAIRFPQSLVTLVIDKAGAVLGSELAQDGDHRADVETLTADGMEPIGMFPIAVGEQTRGSTSRIRFIVVALAAKALSAQEWSESSEGVMPSASRMQSELRIIPIQMLLDVTGQFLCRMKTR